MLFLKPSEEELLQEVLGVVREKGIGWPFADFELIPRSGQPRWVAFCDLEDKIASAILAAHTEELDVEEGLLL